MIIIITVLISAAVVLLAQAKIYKNHAYDKLEYKIDLSVSEVFENEEIYIYEEIRNRKLLPIPFLKVDTQLPEGLSFHIAESVKGKDKAKKGEIIETFPSVIHSVFVLRGNQMIRRRWKVRCTKRGTYRLGSVTMISNDIFGSYQNSRVMEPDKSSKSTVTVLPRAVDLKSEFTASKYTNGEFLVESSLLSDPLLKAGVREYAAGDPMNRINWLQSAVHDKLMVNIEEYTNRHRFNIVLNMQSRDMEKNIPGPSSAPYFIELCLTVAASILDKVSGENIPVRIIANTPPENICDDLDEPDPDSHPVKSAGSYDDTLSRLFVSPVFKGKNDMLSALRILARLELIVSTPVERMMDCIVENPYSFADSGNIIFISAYLSERMINMCYTLRRMGINCIFYITSANSNALIIPDDIEVHFKTYLEED